VPVAEFRKPRAEADDPLIQRATRTGSSGFGKTDVFERGISMAGLLVDDVINQSEDERKKKPDESLGTRIVAPRKLQLILAFVVSCFLCPSAQAQAQGSFYQNLLVGPTGQPKAGATVTVCRTTAIAASPTGATETGNTVTITTSSPHGFVVGQVVQVTGAMVTGYNGIFAITAVPLTTTFQYADATSELGTSGNGAVLPTSAPCTPTATIYSDIGLTTPKTNPTTTDGVGNFSFFVAPGLYVYTVTGAGITAATSGPFVFQSPCIAGQSCVTTSGSQTFTGNNTFTGTMAATNVNNVLYVGGPLGSSWGSGDIGSQFNAAYAALPAAGGDIVLLPQTGGGCYLYTTPIVMNTSGKYVHVRSAAPGAGLTSTTTSGACIQYQHTTATTAVTYDVTPSGGGSYVGGEAWQDITIKNSSTNGGSIPCSTNGGCGSSATGIKIGGTNGGAQLANWANLTVEGFGVGIKDTGSLGIGWAENFYNLSLAYNNIGGESDGIEGSTFYGGSISVNGTGWKYLSGGSAGGTNHRFYGTHFNSNTVLALDGTTAGSAGIIDCIGCHFENLGTTNVNYVNLGGGAGFLNLQGGEGQDDNPSGSAAAYWFTANYLSCSGFSVFANVGRPAPTSLFVATNGGSCNVVNNAGSVLTGTLGLANIPHSISGSGVTPEIGAPHLQSGQATPPNCVWGAGGGTGSSCTVAGSDSVGVISGVAGSSAGSSSTVQLKFHNAFTGTAAACQYSAAGNWAAGATFQDTTPANNTDTFTWTNGGSTNLTNGTIYKINYFCPGR
jgi:hypothetical protein